MKKIITLLTCLALLLCTSCSKGSDEPTVEEPLYYSDEIRIVTKNLSSIEDLSGKVLAVQESFDKEYSDYVIEQLKEEGVELSEENLHWFITYAEIKPDIDDGIIDAWVVVGNREDSISDYRSDYHPSDYKTLATYKKPYYEEKTYDTAGLDMDLYSKPFMVMLNGLDGYGEDSVHEWKYYRNDVNHLLVVDPVRSMCLLFLFLVILL